jgi:hypothetical protein
LKSACCGISKLEPEATIGEMRIKNNNVPWLKTKVSKFCCCNKGWPTQPSLFKFKNLLIGQKNMAKQIARVYTNNERSKQ